MTYFGHVLTKTPTVLWLRLHFDWCFILHYDVTTTFLWLWLRRDYHFPMTMTITLFSLRLEYDYGVILNMTWFWLVLYSSLWRDYDIPITTTMTLFWLWLDYENVVLRFDNDYVDSAILFWLRQRDYFVYDFTAPKVSVFTMTLFLTMTTMAMTLIWLRFDPEC